MPKPPTRSSTACAARLAIVEKVIAFGMNVVLVQVGELEHLTTPRAGKACAGTVEQAVAFDFDDALGLDVTAAEPRDQVAVLRFELLPRDGPFGCERRCAGNPGEAGDGEVAELEIVEGTEQCFVAGLDRATQTAAKAAMEVMRLGALAPR